VDERRWVEILRNTPNLAIQYITALWAGTIRLIQDSKNFERTFLRNSLSYLILIRILVRPEAPREDEAARIMEDLPSCMTGNGGEFGVTFARIGFMLELATRLRFARLSRTPPRNPRGTDPAPFGSVVPGAQNWLRAKRFFPGVRRAENSTRLVYLDDRFRPRRWPKFPPRHEADTGPTTARISLTMINLST